jgi:hypothetical protein
MINGPPRTADWRDHVRSASTAQLRVPSTAASEAEPPDADAADAKPQRWSARRPPRSALKKERSRSNIEYSLLASLTSGGPSPATPSLVPAHGPTATAPTPRSAHDLGRIVWRGRPQGPYQLRDAWRVRGDFAARDARQRRHWLAAGVARVARVAP